MASNECAVFFKERWRTVRAAEVESDSACNQKNDNSRHPRLCEIYFTLAAREFLGQYRSIRLNASFILQEPTSATYPC